MKRLISYITLAVMVITTSGCFKPDETGSKEAASLNGYWETIRLKEQDYSYETGPDGNKTNESRFEEEYDIAPNDGNENWRIIRFQGGMVSIIASDCEDDMETYGIPFTYSLSGNRLTSMMFSGDFTNVVTIEFTGEDEMTIFLDDSGKSTEDGWTTHQEFKSWTTYRRYTQNQE